MRETPARERADVRVNMDGVSVKSEIEVQVVGPAKISLFAYMFVAI